MRDMQLCSIMLALIENLFVHDTNNDIYHCVLFHTMYMSV